MKQEITIEVPKDWSAITLRKYLQLQKDLETYKDEPAAVTAVMFHHLCGINAEITQKIDIKTYTAIREDLNKFMSNTESKLEQIIDIDGVKYGFEPNLSQMSYGAYVDLSKYDEITINDKWAEIMSILYRPVVKRLGDLYDIQEYKGFMDSEIFLDVPMNIHFGALHFLFFLLRDLHNAIPNYMSKMEGISPNIKSILRKSGKLIQRL
jgi:hypothetical protein